MNKLEEKRKELENKQKEILKLKEELQNIKIYETVLILTLKTDIERYDNIKLEIQDIIGKNNLEKFEEKGKGKLAYEVKGNKEGYYIEFIWYGNENCVNELEKYFRQEDNIIKFITIRIIEEDM